MSDQSALPDPRIKPVENGNHAWLVGQVTGAILRLAAEEVQHATQREAPHTTVEILDDAEGNHMATIRVTRPSGSYLVTVEPE